MEPSVLADTLADPVPCTEDLARVMALLGLPGDPLYIVKDHTPAVTVCAGRLVNPKTEVTPPAADWIAHGVACAPTV